MNRRRFPSLLASVALAALAGCSKHSKMLRFEAQGDHEFQAGNYDRAELAYRNALVQVPSEPKAIGQLGLLYFQEGRSARALPYLRKGVELKPGDRLLAVTLARDYLALGGAREAEDAAAESLQSDPTDEDALVVLAQAAHSPSDAASASSLLQRLSAHHPDCAGFHLARGILAEAASGASAETEFRRALELDPKSATAHGELGGLALRRGDNALADAELKQAADLSPTRSFWRMRYLSFQLQQGHADEARAELDAIIARAPDYIDARVIRFKLDLAQKRFGPCADEIKLVLERDPGNFEAMMAEGNLALAQNDPSSAISAFKKVKAAYPQVAIVEYQLGLAYLRNHDQLLGEDRLRSALSLDPAMAPAALVLAEAEISRGNAGDAVEVLTKVLSREPRIAQAYLVLGRACLQMKNPAGAMAAYRRMARLFPKDPEASYRVGLTQLQQGDAAGARTSFLEAIHTSPGFAPAWEALVNQDLADKDPNAAAGRVRTLIEQYPKSSGPWTLMARVDLAQGRSEFAERDLLKAIDLDPNGATPYLMLARIYQATRRAPQAEKLLTQLAARTKDLRADMQLAAIHLAERRFPDALADYQQALAIDPKYAPALLAAAGIYGEALGQLDQAQAYIQRAHDAAPNDPRAAGAQGWLMMKKGDFQGARPFLEKSAAQLPSDAELQYHLASDYYFLGDEQAARLAFQRVLDLAPVGSAAAAGARVRLALLNLDPSRADAKITAALATHLRAEPRDPVALERQAAVEERQSDPAGAARDYAAAIKLAPGNAQVLLRLALLYAGPLHDPVKARDAAKSAHELAPDDPRVALTLGRLVGAGGDFSWSLDLLQEAARGMPADAQVSYELAWAQYRMGRVAEAQQSLAAAEAAAEPGTRDAARQFARLLTAGATGGAAEAAAGSAAALLQNDPKYLPARMVLGRAREAEGNFDDAARIYAAILADDPPFSPAAVRLGVADYRIGRYEDAEQRLREISRSPRADPETLFCDGMSLVHLGQPIAAKAVLRRALAGGLAPADSAQARRALAAK